jgi:hypothetical protein
VKFRKKPVIIEAFQMTPERRTSNEEWPRWMHEAWQMDYHEAGSLTCEDYPNSDGTDHLQIRTLEGVMRIGWGDWIIRGVQGEIYPCKPDIFAATYEPVLDLENDQREGRAGSGASPKPPTL